MKALKIVVSVFCSLMILNIACISSVTVNANNDINVVINGEAVIFNDDTGYPYIDENNRTMVPLRVTMESAGFVVGYDTKAQTAIVITGHGRIEVPIGTNKVYINNILEENDTTAVIKDGRTYLPIRIILEAAYYTVEWNAKAQTINAYSDGSNYIQMHYWDDDLNTAIYPEPSRYDVITNSNLSEDENVKSNESEMQYEIKVDPDNHSFKITFPDLDIEIPSNSQEYDIDGIVD